MTTPDITKIRNAMRIIATASSVLVAMGAGAAYAQVDTTDVNHLTGYNSVNHNRTTINDTSRVTVDNRSTATNRIHVNADTGNVRVSRNTTVDGVSTGDVMGSFQLTNTANNAASDALSGLDLSLDVTHDGRNDTTGANSRNENNLTVRRNTTISERNTSKATNNVDVRATTGNLHVDRNTTVGDISTGSVDVTGDISNTASHASSVDLSGLGNTSVSSTGVNNLTGASSSNTNTTDVRSDTKVSVTNNATADNTVKATANTGNVTATENTTVGNIHTGDASFDLTVNNDL